MRLKNLKNAFLSLSVFLVMSAGLACQTTQRPSAVNAATQAKSILSTDLRNLPAMKILIKEALLEKKPHEAIELCENALLIATQDADLYSLQALAQYQLNYPLYAKALWQKALNLDPLHVASLMNLGLLLFQNGHTEKAGAHFDKILAIAPDHLNALTGRALVMSAQGQSERAISMLEEVLRKKGDNALLLENLALISRDRLKDYKLALKYTERLLALKQTDRRTLETAVSLKQDIKRMIAAQNKTLSDESLREMASASPSQSATRAEQEAPQAQQLMSNDLMKMEDFLK